jgi:hypothetical protein
MTRAPSPRQRKPTVWDSKIAVCHRLGYLRCQVVEIGSDPHVELRSCPAPPA